MLRRQKGMPVAAEMIGAQLVAHDEQDVARRAHRSGRDVSAAPANGGRGARSSARDVALEALTMERIPRYSLKPDRLMIGPHRAVSAPMIAASASGVVPV